MTRPLSILAVLILLPACESLMGGADDNPPVEEPAPTGIHGTLTNAASEPMGGLMVTAKAANNIETTVFTNAAGAFQIDGLADGAYEVTAHYPGFQRTTAPVTQTGGVGPAMAMTIETGDRTSDVPTSAWLAKLPAGDMRQELILNCGTCHGLTADRVAPDGVARDQAGWAEVIAAMRAMDVYKVIPPDFDDAAYAAWLAEHLAADKIAKVAAPAPMDPAKAAGLVITEYPIPHQDTELPHDVVVGPDGRIWVTGFWTGEIWALDPATGVYETFDVYEKRDPKIPAQTRALEFDRHGILWIINGGQSAVVSLDPATKEIKTYPVGMYAHDIVLDSKGDPWFNDYFAKTERIGHLSVETGKVSKHALPSHNSPPAVGVPLPYGLMVDRKDRLFSTQLAGNTVVRYDIATGDAKLYDMPNINVGPRRTAIDSEGKLWIPEYNTGKVDRFDPEAETFETTALGVATAGPYDVDINTKTGEIWVSGSLDSSMFRIDPVSKAVLRIQLPTEPALIRHVATDGATGDVWITYSSLPTAVPKVARVSYKP